MRHRRQHEYRFFEGKGFPCSRGDFVLKTDFRVWLRYGHILGYPGMDGDEKASLILSLCLDKCSASFDPQAALKAISWFHSCGEDDRLSLLENVTEVLEDLQAKRSGCPREYDPFWDFRHVWASFKWQYGLDLYRDDLHWWAYVALFNQLQPESAIGALMRLRGTDMRDIPAERRDVAFMSQMIAALPEGYGD